MVALNLGVFYTPLPNAFYNSVLPASPATHVLPPMLVETPVGPEAALKQVAVNLNTGTLFEDYNEAVQIQPSKGPRSCLCQELSCHRNLVMPTMIFLDKESLSRSNEQRHTIKIQCLENSLPPKVESLYLKMSSSL